MSLRFVSYDGEYPNLCRGNLVMELDGKQITFPEYCLSSGGYVRFDENWSADVGLGPWTITRFPAGFPVDLKEYATWLVNQNVRQGCCGGCI